jgi:hypothetical protein
MLGALTLSDGASRDVVAGEARGVEMKRLLCVALMMAVSWLVVSCGGQQPDTPTCDLTRANIS